MRFVHPLPAALAGVAGFIFLSAFQASAEKIYQWKNRDGATCYSNTNVPAGASELSVMRAAVFMAPEVQEPGPGGAAGEDGARAADGSEDGSEDGSGLKAAALQARIERRSASIRHIEMLLRTYPDDADLRKHLERKRRYLNEDLILLKLIED